MTSLYANLRFPFAFALGLVLTASLFWVLWFFTNKTFDYEVVAPTRIEFTRLKRDETLTTKDREPKVVREAPLELVDLPPISGARNPGIDTGIFVVNTAPDLVFDGIPVGAGSDRDAVPLVRVEPTYPPRAQQQGLEGWVQLQFNISATGAVTDVSVVASEPGTTFDAAAVNAVSRWRYSPSVVEGRAMERVGMQTLIRFDMED